MPFPVPARFLRVEFLDHAHLLRAGAGRGCQPHLFVRWLGYAEIVLGLADSCMEGYGLVFWTLGFGVLHIVYGIAFCLLHPKK